jgi:alcohol dehydrogenase, propanol-preferring
MHPLGSRVGVPWLHAACEHCLRCQGGHENLCERASFTGWSVDGGYAQYVVAREDYSFAIPPAYSDEEAAPLLCAGLIGYRALRMLPQARAIGLYGFGASAHLVAQMPPAPMDGAILFAPAGELVPRALQAVAPAGTVVCAGIHMSDIPGFPYRCCGRSAASAQSQT